ncbi:MAG: RND transporter, partial [Nitrospirae bacterium CG_4_9_14_3_um_filter_53_35]
TIGLAPFAPPHVWEKLRMLAKGRLVRPLDWFDLFMHGAPWILLILKGLFSLKK